MIKLKENERLISAGFADLRAPNGEPLRDVPLYTIISVEETEAAEVREAGENERIILAGRIFGDKKASEERFAALKAGREPAPREEGAPLYILEDAKYINPETGLTTKEESSIRILSGDLCEEFAMHMIDTIEQILQKKGSVKHD